MKTNAARLLAALLFLVAACGKDNDKPGPGPNPGNTPGKDIPEIISFTPGHGMITTDVVIKGKNFGATAAQNEVKFKGATFGAVVKAASATELTVSVPTDAITGKIIIKTSKGSDTSATDFVVDPEVAGITDFSPKQGPFGTEVTLTGRKFDVNNIVVKINGVEAKLVSRSITQIKFTIPINTSLTSHKIDVTSGADALQTADNFTVTAPGPYATWQKKNITFLNEGTNVFPLGLSFAYKNKLYWGFTRLSTFENTADYVVFDPAQPANGWVLQNKPPANMAPADLQLANAVVHNNRVFLGTGLAGGASNKWFEFFPETNTATQLTSYPEAVSGAISFVVNNHIYVGFGGNNKKLYQFNPAGNNNQGSWDLAATGTFSELNTGNAFVLGNDVYMGRALPAIQQLRRAMYKFTEPGTITQVADMPEEMTSFTTPSFTIGNKGYFVISKNVWEFSPSAAGGEWRCVLSLAGAPTIAHVAVVTVNGAPVVYGWTAAGTLYEFKI